MGSPLAELKTAMKGLKSEIKVMETALGKGFLAPYPMSMLEMNQGKAKYYWNKVETLYDRLQVLTKHEEAEVEPIASGELQTCYKDLDARVERALDDYYLDEKAPKHNSEIRARTYEKIEVRMNAAEVAEPPAAMKKVMRPTKPVSRKVVKASLAGASTIKNKLLKKTTKSTKKPSPAKKDEKPYEEPSVEKG